MTFFAKLRGAPLLLRSDLANPELLPTRCGHFVQVVRALRDGGVASAWAARRPAQQNSIVRRLSGLQMNSRRITVASIIAPPAGILAISVLAGVSSAREQGASWSQTFAIVNDGLFFLMLFGAPVGYVAEAIVGVPTYYWLVRTGRLRVYWVVAAAALAGVLAFAPWFISSRWSDIAQSLLIGAFGGAVGGAVFWATAFLGRSGAIDV